MILSTGNCKKLILTLRSMPRKINAHSLRVGLYMQILGGDILSANGEISESASNLARELGYYHDIGKAVLPIELLKKDEPFSPEEYELYKTHTLLSQKILDEKVSSANDIERTTINLIALTGKTHHENWDGTGYPLGLSGTDIPFWGRLCAVANAYDHLRTIKPISSHKKALEFLESKSGILFDPQIVDALLKHEKEIRILKKNATNI